MKCIAAAVKVYSRLPRRKVQLDRVPVRYPGVLPHILSQGCGVYVLEYRWHCFVLDMGRRLVVDTDPAHSKSLLLITGLEVLAIRPADVRVAFFATSIVRA